MEDRRLEGRCWTRSLVFAAVAAFAAPAVAVGAASWLGTTTAFRVVVVALAVGYAWIVAPPKTRRLRVVALGSVLGLAALALTATVREAVLGAAVIVALLRTGLLYRASGLRGPALELVLGGLGLAVAAQWRGLGVGGFALGVWSYFLVQSAYFVVSGIGRRGRVGVAGDEFERAAARLEELLDETAEAS